MPRWMAVEIKIRTGYRPKAFEHTGGIYHQALSWFSKRLIDYPIKGQERNAWTKEQTAASPFRSALHTG